MKFNYSLRRPAHRRRRLALEAVVILAGLLTVIGVGLYYYYRSSPPDKSEVVSTSLRSSVEQVRWQNFATDYFSFDAPTIWREDAAASTPSTYVYQAYNNNLVEQDMTIYVNNGDQPAAVTRILPVELKGSSLSPVGPISDHCRERLTPVTKVDTMVTDQGVKFNCDSDGTLFNVSVGLAGGSPRLTLPSANGLTNHYVIVYRDLRFNPNGRDLTDIIKTFQAY